jgi:hypothetical protein
MTKITLWICALAAAVSLAPGATLAAQTPAAIPAASPVPPMLPEEVDYWAVRLAGQVLKGGQNVVPDLVRAMQLAGITVCGLDGHIVAEPLEPRQNIVFADAEMALMASMLAKRMTVPIEGLSDGLSSAITGLAKAPLPALLIEGISTKAGVDIPTVRFWARFIVELGRQSSDPYDLLGKVDAAKVRLNTVQMALILQRLAADMAVMEVRARKHGPFPSPAARVLPTPGDAPQFLFAGTDQGNPLSPALDTSGGPRLGFLDTQDQPRLPACEWSIDRWYAPNNADEVALGIGIGFDKILSILEESEKWAENVGSRLAAANILLAYVKVIWIMATMDVTMEMDGTGPLIRTQNRNPGERRQLTATVRMNTGNAQFVNCLRTALNMVGLDVDLPVNGPLKGAGVGWDGAKGFKPSVRTGDTWEVSEPIVELENPGPRVQDQNKKVNKSDTTTLQRMRTDDFGKSSIGVHGAPQKKLLDPLQNGKTPLVPVAKEFSVGVNIQVEPPTIRSTVVDALAFRGSFGEGVTGVLTPNPVALLGLPPDLFLKSHWMLSPDFTFPLTDWEPCAEGWVGTIEVTTMLETSTSTRSAAGGKTGYMGWTSYNQLIRQATFVLHGGVTKIGPGAWIQMPADVVGRYEENNFITGTGYRMLCAPKVTQEVTTSHEIGVGSTTMQVEMSASDKNKNGYKIACGAPEVPTTIVTWTHKKENEVKCQSGYDVQRTNTTKSVKYGAYFEIEGQFDPKRPGVAAGTMTTEDPDWGTMVVKWSLRRCN